MIRTLNRSIQELLPPQIDAVNARASMLRESGVDVISLGQAIPGFPPPAEALAAAERALSNPVTHIYSADAGLIELRQALCGRLKESFAIDADPETEVIITAGANQAFLLALLTILNRGDEVVLPSPYFMNHETAVRVAGGIPVEAPLTEERGFCVGLHDVEPYLNPRTKAVVIVSPSNPTGAVTSRSDVAELSSFLLERGVFVISDETYMHFVQSPAVHSSPCSLSDWRRGTMMIGSFSKSFALTGWRAGYLMAPPHIIAESLKIQDAMVICAPVISQKAALAAVMEAWDYPSAFVRELEQRRQCLIKGLERIPALHWRPTHGGFFAFVRVEGCVSSEALAEEILQQVGIVTIPGSAFGRAGESHLRLSYGSLDISRLEEALRRLERFFHQYNKRRP